MFFLTKKKTLRKKCFFASLRKIMLATLHCKQFLQKFPKVLPLFFQQLEENQNIYHIIINDLLCTCTATKLSRIILLAFIITRRKSDQNNTCIISVLCGIPEMNLWTLLFYSMNMNKIKHNCLGWPAWVTHH